jgi:hypothetical protein
VCDVRALTILTIVAFFSGFALQASADESKRGSVELGVITGVTLFLAEDETDFTGHVPSGSSGIHAPITPALRLTLWSDTPLLMDFGASFFSSNVFGQDFTALNFEFGLGVRTTHPARVVTSASILLGFVSWSNESTTTDGYLGGQAGIRAFINDRTSARVQLGYRHTLQGPEQGFDIDAVEIGIGLGVFL